MLDAIVAFTSTFMLLQSYVGPDWVPQEISKLVEFTSPLRNGVESVTLHGKCFNGMTSVPCHLILAGCKIHCMLKWTVLFPIFFGMALLAVVFVGVTQYYIEDDADWPQKGLKELARFTTFLLGLSALAGLAASVVGVALRVAPIGYASTHGPLNIYVGWAEVITMALTICQMMLTMTFHKQSKKMLSDRQGSILLADVEQAEPLLSKEDIFSAGTPA